MTNVVERLITALDHLATNMYLASAILCGAGIAYLIFQMPSVAAVAAKIEELFPKRSKQFRARVEFGVLLACGWATVNFLVNPHEPNTAFVSGFTWYSLLAAVKGVGVLPVKGGAAPPK
jgi:hypothetical protein